MIILGLDIATTTGYAIIEKGNLINFGTFTLTEEEHSHRFKTFRKTILKLVKQYKPNIVVIEQTYVGSNVKTTAYLNMLRGICLECLSNNIIVLSSTVSRIRKETLGEGKKHTKEDVFSYITNKYKLNLDIKQKNILDITDSILLAEWGEKISCLD